MGFAGVLCGRGHTVTLTAVGVLTSALLAWKERLAGFSVGLTEPEPRSAILLGIVALVVYPVLPPGPIDPWHVVELRVAWMTVIRIAGMGFILSFPHPNPLSARERICGTEGLVTDSEIC